MITASEFSKRLKNAREKAGMKQKDLAELAGISPQTISTYEAGKVPTLQNAAKLAETLHTSLDELIGLSAASTSDLKTVADVILSLEKVFSVMICNIEARSDQLHITLFDSDLAVFYEKREKMRRLVSEGTIDIDLYSSWFSGELEKLKNTDIDPLEYLPFDF